MEDMDTTLKTSGSSIICMFMSIYWKGCQMSHLKYSVAAFVLVCMCASASAAVLYFEDFESYAAGTSLHEINGWEGWYGAAGSAASASGQQAYNGTKSVVVKGGTDAARVFDITEGKWVLTAQQYIPSGTSGETRFHMQNTYRNGAIGRSVQWSFSLSDGVIGDDYDLAASASIIYNEWVELKLVIDLDNDLLEQYYNGKLFSTRAWVNSGTSQIQSINLFGNGASSIYYDDIQIQDYLSSLVTAHNPSPEDDMIDVSRDVVLQWESGIHAQTHDVYFGTDFNTVDNATPDEPMDVLVSPGQTEDAYDPEGYLDFSKTYYWRVDEVNGTPDKYVYKGETWSFEVEPYSIKLPFEAITVTASSENNDTTHPDRTIDGSGLDDPENENALHSNAVADVMWMSASGDSSPWLMYEFDTVQKLDKLLIWNSNHSSESVIGWGVKDVEIETSEDGLNWTALPDVGPITRGPGFSPSEAHAIDMGLIQARFVRLNILNNWGGVLPQYAVAEVQFYSLPMLARTPAPASGSTGISPRTVVSWRSGREAAQHTVTLSSDVNAVADGTASSVSSMTNSLDLTSLDLQLGETYFWRVDEVNEAQVPSVWAGPVWSLSASTSLIVDDFEGYSNVSPDRPFQTWLDGAGYSADEFFPVAYEGNGTDAGVGHDIWTVSSPHFDGQIMEETLTLPGSAQSLPVYYSNTGGSASQIDRTWAVPQMWSGHGIQTLVVNFYGQVDNTGGPLYVTINGEKVTYPDNADLSLPVWHQWNIDLVSLGIDVDAVASLSIGVEGIGNGLIYVDDIGLYGETTPDPGE